MNKVIVIGSINMDIITRTEALPLPGQTVAGRTVEFLPGGKGLNQAVACAKMGIETVLAGCFGNDAFAENLRLFLEQHHINTDWIKQSDKESGTAFITVDDAGRNTIVVVPGSNAAVSAENTAQIPVNHEDIVIGQFEIPLPAVTAFFRRAKEKGAKTILNPSPVQNIPEELLASTDILIVNETELSFLSGFSLDEETPLTEIENAAAAVKRHSEQIIIVTLGHRGAMIIEKEICRIDSFPVKAVDTVGAGDCFAGVLAARLLLNHSVADCARFANKAASVCVTRKGAAPSMPRIEELTGP